ncbi:MAG: hypothetical protein ACM3ZF_01970 [Mycobacterium leprae]
MLLVGGGPATFITGLIAVAFEIPLVAVTAFGGSGQKVWQALDRVRNDAEQADLDLMGADWHDGLPADLVGSLLGSTPAGNTGGNSGSAASGASSGAPRSASPSPSCCCSSAWPRFRPPTPGSRARAASRRSSPRRC